MPRVAFYTLGCKLNQYETELMREQLEEAGYRCVDFEQDAELYVINTCTVTGRSDARSRQMIRRAAQRAGDRVVVVTGCYAQRSPEQILQISGVDLVLGNVEKSRILEFLLAAQPKRVCVSDIKSQRQFSELEINGFARHTRAFLKIQDGCDGTCSYCVVPTVRGRSRSRPLAAVKEQVHAFIRAGYHELVLTGVNLGRYRDPEYADNDLLALLEWLEGCPDLGRVRLSSIEPTDISDELIRFLGQSEKICRHLHIPMQSGDDAILQSMGRPYRASDFSRLIEKLAGFVPGIAIGVDVIVGFPGEQADQFKNTRSLLENLPICRFHVFRFSRRAGTPAASMEPQVSADISRHRGHLLRDLSRKKFEIFRRSFIHRQLVILTEKRRDHPTGLLTGLSDNYIRVLIDGPDELMNKLLPVTIYRIDDSQAWARLSSRDEGR